MSDTSLNYKQRLFSCDTLPLSLRRDFLDVVFMYNSINDINDFDINTIARYSDGNGRNLDGLNLI